MQVRVGIDDIIEKGRRLFSWGQTQVYWAFRVTLSLVLCAALKIRHEEPADWVVEIKYPKALTFILHFAVCSSYAVYIIMFLPAAYKLHLFCQHHVSLNVWLYGLWRRVKQRGAVLVWFVYASMCNISHWGCNLTHKFLIHSLYQGFCKCGCFHHVTPPHLDVPPPSQSHAPYTHISLSIPLPRPLPHPVPCTLCLPLALRLSISWKKPNVRTFHSLRALFLHYSWIKWTLCHRV